MTVREGVITEPKQRNRSDYNIIENNNIIRQPGRVKSPWKAEKSWSGEKQKKLRENTKFYCNLDGIRTMGCVITTDCRDFVNFCLDIKARSFFEKTGF